MLHCILLQVVHRMFRHAGSAGRDPTVCRLFKPRDSAIQSAMTIEDALGFCFKEKRLMETATIHSCAFLFYFFGRK